MNKRITAIAIVLFGSVLSACSSSQVQSEEPITASVTKSSISPAEREQNEKIMETAEKISIGVHKNETIAFFSDEKGEKGGLIIKTAKGSSLSDYFIFGGITVGADTEKEYYDYNKKKEITIKTANYKISDADDNITFEKGVDENGNNIIVFETGEFRSIQQGSIDDLMILVNEYNGSVKQKSVR